MVSMSETPLCPSALHSTNAPFIRALYTSGEVSGNYFISARATEVQRYRGTEVQRYRGTEVQRYRGTEVQSYRATEVQRYRGTEVQRCSHAVFSRQLHCLVSLSLSLMPILRMPPSTDATLSHSGF